MNWRLTSLVLAAVSATTPARADDPRIRRIVYDPASVIAVGVRKGVSTHIELERGEAIRHVSSGLGAECARIELPWCVDAKAGQEHIFVKARSAATSNNTLSVVTDRRSYTFDLQLLPDATPRQPVLRLVVRAEPAHQVDPAQAAAERRRIELLQHLSERQAAMEQLAREELRMRLQRAPDIVNSEYSVAVGQDSEEIAPTLIYDDGRFTYLRFPGNREIPAVFQVAEDGSESMINARMEDDLLVADRVTRRLVLRKGDAVVGVFNEAFDINGRPPEDGTAAPGVERVFKAGAGAEHPVEAASGDPPAKAAR